MVWYMSVHKLGLDSPLSMRDSNLQSEIIVICSNFDNFLKSVVQILFPISHNLVMERLDHCFATWFLEGHDLPTMIKFEKTSKRKSNKSWTLIWIIAFLQYCKSVCVIFFGFVIRKRIKIQVFLCQVLTFNICLFFKYELSKARNYIQNILLILQALGLIPHW